MKKTIGLLVTLVMVMLLASCGNSVVKEALEQGKAALQEKQYDKALASFDLVLDNDKENKEAISLKGIIQGYQTANEKFNASDIEGSKQIIDAINQEYSNYAIKEDIDNLKGQIDKKIEFNNAFNKEMDEANKLFTDKAFDKCEKALETLKSKELDSKQKESVEELSKKVKEEKDKIKKQKEEEEKKKAAQGISRSEAEKILKKKINFDSTVSGMAAFPEMDRIKDGIRYYEFETVSITGEGGAAWAYYVNSKTGEVIDESKWVD